MTQSDSPDFEFDISDLEVESVESSPSNDGEDASRADVPEAAGDKGQVDEGQVFSGKVESEEEGEEESFDGFAIDEIPDAFDGDQSVAEELPTADGSAIDGGDLAEEEVEPVSRVEEKPREKPSRTLGADDLGADVFAEIDTDSEAMSFEDVIDDLMDEVEEFEAGGFVELDEEASSVGGEEGDGLFKMEDPDDSLAQSIDPNAEEDAEDEVLAAEPAFPSPPVDFEIPADPEPEAEPVAEVEDASEDPVEEAPEAEDVVAEAIPADDLPEEKVAEDDSAETVAKAPAAAKPDFSNFEIPADPVEEKVAETSTEAAVESEPVDAVADEVEEIGEIPADEEPVDAVDEETVESVAEEPVAEERKPAEGRENVFFAAEDEEAPAALEDEEEEDLSDLLASVSSEEEEAEEVVGEEVAEAEAVEEDPVEVPSEAEVEPEVEEAIASEAEDESSQEIGGLSELEDEEEDISELLAAVSEQADEEEVSIDEAAVESVEGEEEAAPVEPGLMEVEEEAEVAADEAVEEELPAEAAEVSGLSEVEEEDTDLSELIASVAEQEEDGSPDEDEEVVAMPDPSSMMAAAGSGLAVIDDEEEEVEVGEADGPGLAEVPEAEESEEAVAAPAMPTAEDLLRQAGSLLNGGAENPEAGANALLDALDDDEEEIVAMPSPDALISDAVIDDDEEVVAMPDPLAMMEEAAPGLAVVDDDDDEEEVAVSGNVADRAGDLPPPPPAPVEIIDDEPPEEDIQPEAPAPAVEAVAEDDEAGEASDLQDPFSAEISLDDFNEDLGGLEDLDIDATDADATDADGEESAEDGAELGEKPAAKAAAPAVAEPPKLSLLWRVTHSLSVAAGLVLVGLASVLGVWKQQIVEYYEGRDIDGSALVQEIEEIGTHALSKFDENGLYRMQWVDSEVRRVSENEIRLHALVGAQLRENLYVPVLESALGDRMGFDEGALQESLHFAHTMFPEEVGHFPAKPWDRLYELSAAKDEILSLRVSYSLKRESAESDWELSRIKVTGYKKDLVWPEGEPKYSFGENAYDVDSLEFATLISEYKDESKQYMARIDGLRNSMDDERMALQRENYKQRERVKMALAEGAYFNGVAILGEDADASRDVQLVITEVRDGGAFVKGVVRMDQSERKSSKHFVGSLDFETTLSGKEQGILNLTTVSLDSPQAMASDSPFFEPGSVSRMRLKADGFRLEGDSRDLSFRFTRSL